MQGGKLKYLQYIFPLLMLILVLGKEFYVDYRQEQRHEYLKEVFHGLLFDGDSRTNVRSVSLTDKVIRVAVNIQNTIVTDDIRSKLRTNAHSLLPAKVCSSVGLLDMMQNGTRVSIDVIANSNVTITNVRVTFEDCT